MIHLAAALKTGSVQLDKSSSFSGRLGKRAAVTTALPRAGVVIQLAPGGDVLPRLDYTELADFVVGELAPRAAASVVAAAADTPAWPPPTVALHEAASHSEVEKLRQQLEEKLCFKNNEENGTKRPRQRLVRQRWRSWPRLMWSTSEPMLPLAILETVTRHSTPHDAAACPSQQQSDDNHHHTASLHPSHTLPYPRFRYVVSLPTPGQL